jgi:hypothetical protein
MAPDIVANAIVAAISAGAVTGATDTAKSAIADAYEGLKSLIKKKFGHDSEPAQAIDKLEAKPDSDGKKQVLAEELKAVNSSSDPELVAAAESLLALIKALAQGEAHHDCDGNRYRPSRPWQHGNCHHVRTAKKRCLTNTNRVHLVPA